MMDAFRGSKKLIGVVFTVLMVVFMLTAVDYSAFMGAGSVGEIDGERVDARTYETLVQQQIQSQQRQSPEPMSLDQIQQIRDATWENLIQSRILEAEYDERNIEATTEEVIQVMRANPPPEIRQAPEFQTDGTFDPGKYQRWLSSTAAQPLIPMLAAGARDQIRRSKLYLEIAADVYISDAELWQEFRDRSEQVTVALTALVPRMVVPDSAVEATPEEVAAYYQAHPEEFERPATAFLSYVALPRTITAEDTAAALERARELRAEILAGAPFAEVAARESADPASAQRGGELGSWVRGQFDPAFDSVAFSIPLDSLSEPVLSAFGYHLIEVTSRQGDTATARHILVPIELSGERRDQLDAKADTLDRLAAEQLDPAALDTAAQVLGLPIGRTGPVQEGTRVLVGRTVVPDAGVWAFRAQVGELSPLIEAPNALWVFRLDSLHPAGTPPLDQIRRAVATAVRIQKKEARAREIAEEYLGRVEGGASLAEAAEAMGLPHRTVGPFSRVSPPLPNPVLIGTAFGLEPGQRSGILDTDEGLYVIEVLERTPADSAEFQAQIDQLRARAIGIAQQQRIRSFMQALREQVEVEDRRAEFLRNATPVDAATL